MRYQGKLLPEWIIAMKMLPYLVEFQFFGQCPAHTPAPDDAHCFILIIFISGNRHFTQQPLGNGRVIHRTQNILKHRQRQNVTFRFLAGEKPGKELGCIPLFFGDDA